MAQLKITNKHKNPLKIKKLPKEWYISKIGHWRTFGARNLKFSWAYKLINQAGPAFNK